jgi:GNAT superfamily N-acetyltransferase
MAPRIRLARPDDASALEAIENEADRLLTDLLQPDAWPPAPAGSTRLAEPGFVLVVELPSGEVAGFAHVLEADGVCHLEQLSVGPVHARRGLGRKLLDAAKDHARPRGHERMTLRTYADVPWNAPFYETAGFAAEEPATPLHRSLIDVEARLGLDRLGRRLQMAAPF